MTPKVCELTIRTSYAMIPLRNVHVLKPDAISGVTLEHIQGLAESYGTNGHRAPVVLGHPKDNSPAWGWVNKCHQDGDNLLCDLDVTPEFKELLDRGLFRERSVAFYNSKPYQLRHLGFLGATPPQVKGLEPINLSESIEPYMTQTTSMPPSTPSEGTTTDQTAAFARPVVLFALSEVLPGVKASNLVTEPSVTDGSISGSVTLSDGQNYSYTINKVGSEWKASTTLQNPEVVTLSEQVRTLQHEVSRQKASAVVNQFYLDHKLTEAILPKSECLEMVALCEGQVGQSLLKMLGNLPSLVNNAPTVESAVVSPSITGFEQFQLSDTTQYAAVQAKAIELGLNPSNPQHFVQAFNSL